MNTKNAACFLVGALLAGGCQDGGSANAPTPPGPAGEPAPLTVGPERQTDLTKHAVLAFRPENGSLVGGYRTHQASIGDGIIEVTPFTFEAGERRAHAAMSLETTAITTDGAPLADGLSSTQLEDGDVILRRGDVEEHLRNQEDGLHQEWHFAAAPPGGDLVVDVTASGYRFLKATDGGLHFVARDGAGLRYSHAVWSGSDGKEWPITAIFEDGRIRMTIPESVIAGTTFPAVLDPTITAEGAVDTPVVGPTGANQQQSAVAFDGTNYLVVWTDTRDSADADIWGTRLSATGAILDPLGLKIAAGPGVQSNPTVAYNGSSFLVAWEDFRVTGGTQASVAAATVSSAGAVSTLGTVASTTASSAHPVLAARPDGSALLVWNAAGAVTGSIFSSGAFGPAIPIASGAVVERPGNASNPAGNYLVSWSAGTDLHGQFVTSTGALSGAAFNISAALGTQAASAATFDGTNYDVVWENNNAGLNLYGARVSPAGVVLDTRTEGTATVGGVPISTAPDNQQVPAIQCQASGCLVAWQDRRNLASTGFDLFGQLLNPNFTLNGTEFVISNATGNQFGPAIGSSASGFFAAWSDLRDNNAFAIFGSTISSAGTVGAAAPVGTSNNRESTPSLGRAGTLFGLFWSDSRTFGNDIRYVRINSSGSKLDATALVASNAAFAQITAAASTDLGASTFVVWSDTRNGINKDVYGARVSLATGTTVDTAGIALSTAAGDQLVPSVASNGSLALAVWQDRRNGASFDIYGALVDSSGAVVASDIAISTAAGDQTRPAVTWDPASSQFLVVWADQRGATVNIFGTRVSTAGAVLDGAGVQISNGAVGQFSPSIASSATGSFAVWQDRRNAPAGGFNIYGSRLTGGAALGVLDVSGVRVSNNPSKQSQPAIGTIGSGYLVAWSDDRAGQGDIYAQQVNANGTLFGTEFVVSATADDESAPTLLATSARSATMRIAYESHRLDTSRVSTRLISSQVDVGSACSSASGCSTGFCVDGFCCDAACGGNHVPAGTTSAGDCHGCANRFTGQPNGTCAAIPATTICRNYGSTFCDLREYCDGTSLTCGDDVGRNQGLVCDKATNVPSGVGTGVCPSNAAPGPHVCQ